MGLQVQPPTILRTQRQEVKGGGGRRVHSCAPSLPAQLPHTDVRNEEVVLAEIQGTLHIVGGTVT